MSKSKVDIVIPTYNRPEYLKRILEYYSPYTKDFNFIIADSSTPQNKNKNKKIIKDYSSTLSILYLDKFHPTLQQHYKFAQMVKYIKSKYCVFCADDDFIVPKAIKECVEFLKKNPDYSVAHGTYIGFFQFQPLWGLNKLWWKYRYSHQSITSSRSLTRVDHHLRNYTLFIWSVRRSDVVKKCYQEFSKAKLDPILFPEFGEMLPDVLSVVYGKVKRLDTFYAARQYFGSISNYYVTLLQAKQLGIFDREYRKFKKSIIKNLVAGQKVSKEKATKTIDDAIEVYIKAESQEYWTNKINLLLMRYPKFILQTLRILNAMYVFSKDKKDKIGDVSQPSSEFYPDFLRIYNSILKISSKQ